MFVFNTILEGSPHLWKYPLELYQVGMDDGEPAIQDRGQNKTQEILLG